MPHPPIDDEATVPKGAVGKERRRHRRYACNGFAEGVSSKCLFRGEIQDFNEFGCFVMTKAHLHVERLVEVDLRFKINNRHYHTAARVMNVRPGKGVGLEFSHTNRRTEELLRVLNETLNAAAPRE